MAAAGVLVDLWRLHVTAPAVVVVVAGLILTALFWRLHARARIERRARIAAQRRACLADTQQQLVAALSRTTTPARVVEVSLPEFLHASEAAAGVLVLIGDDRTKGEVARAVGCDAPLETSPFPLDSYPGLLVAATRQKVTAIDAPPAPSAGRTHVGSIDFLVAHATALAVPLIAAGRTIGILAIAFDQARSLDADERDLLLTAGRRTAEAYVRARAYETAERARAEAETLRARADQELRERQRAEAALRESETRYRALASRTSRLHAMSAALSESITVDAVAAAIIQHGKIVVGASAGSVALVADGGTHFDMLRADEYAGEPVESWRRIAIEPGWCAAAAVETRQPVLVRSFAECQQEYWRSASVAADGGFASAAFLPLILEDAARGVLAFHFTAPVNFDDEFRALLESVAHHCSQAIDRARLYEGAQRARAQAETANRSKDEFLSTVSHELRTPLTAVLGWAAMLRSGALDPARTTRAVEAIYTNATRQTQMIDELLDISRIVAGRAVLDLHELDLAESIRGAVDAVMPTADGKGVELRLGANPSVAVTADPRRVEQILLNLLSNAVKFTPPGGSIIVDAAVDSHTVEVRVADTGSGIRADFLPYVFERFRQEENTTARTRGGLGLGLFIARQLVEAQGGSIRAESDGPGRGARFTVSLPIAQTGVVPAPVRAAGPPRHAASLSGIRVLLVDDEADVRELMLTALERAGATVTAVESARNALDVLNRADVDVLLADIAMPGQDGYDLIKAVRALPAARAAHVPAAAVTACARDDERQRALAAGFQMHVAKPLEPAALVQAVATLAQQSARC